MTGRKNLVALDNLITGLLLVLIFLFLNLNVSRSTLATDFSGSGLYTLQEPTIELLKGVDDVLNITYYYSPNLAPRTPEYVNMKRDVSNLLQLYKQYGGENVRVNVVDPTDGARMAIPESTRSEMTRKGIVPMSETIQREGESISTTFYSSLEISYGANDRVVNKIGTDDLDNLEVTITKEIQYALNPELVNIGLYVPPRMQQPRRRRRQGGSPPEPQRREDTRSFQDLETKLQDVGVVERIFLEEGERFPDPKNSDLDVLLVLGLRRIPESDLYALDQYIMKGGKVIIAADPVGLKSSPSRSPLRRGGGERRGFLFSNTGKNEKTILDLLEAYGAKGSQHVTLDKTSVRADIPVMKEKTITDAQGNERTVRFQEQVNTEIPFMFKAQPVVAKKTPSFLQGVGQPLVMYPMTFSKVSDASSTYQPWYTTTDMAVEFKQTGGGGPMRSGLRQLHQEATGRFSIENQKGGKRRDLIVSLTGTMSSAFSDDEIPEAMKTENSQAGDSGNGSANGQEAKDAQNDSSSGADEEKKEDREQGKGSAAEASEGKGAHQKKTVDSGELIVVGDADLFKLSQMNRLFSVLLREEANPSPNELFATGSVNHFGRSEQTDLNLEKEQTFVPRLVQLTDQQEKLFSVLLIGLAPVLVILFGLFRWIVMVYGRGHVES